MYWYVSILIVWSSDQHDVRHANSCYSCPLCEKINENSFLFRQAVSRHSRLLVSLIQLSALTTLLRPLPSCWSSVFCIYRRIFLADRFRLIWTEWWLLTFQLLVSCMLTLVFLNQWEAQEGAFQEWPIEQEKKNNCETVEMYPRSSHQINSQAWKLSVFWAQWIDTKKCSQQTYAARATKIFPKTAWAVQNKREPPGREYLATARCGGEYLERIRLWDLVLLHM